MRKESERDQTSRRGEDMTPPHGDKLIDQERREHSSRHSTDENVPHIDPLDSGRVATTEAVDQEDK